MKKKEAAALMARESHKKQKKLYPDYRKEMIRRGKLGGKPKKIKVESDVKDYKVDINKG